MHNSAPCERRSQISKVSRAQIVKLLNKIIEIGKGTNWRTDEIKNRIENFENYGVENIWGIITSIKNRRTFLLKLGNEYY